MTNHGQHTDPIDRIIDQDTALPGVFDLAQQLRVDAIRCSTAAGSGHPTSGMSAADLMAVLMARHLTYDWDLPGDPGNDHLIFSKGHASPLLYAMFRAAGAIAEDVLVDTYRRAGSMLEGHPTPRLPWVDAATGSLGQGIGVGVGLALAGRLREAEQSASRVWVLCGDSEMAEGSVWEALDAAGRYGLSRFTVIVDVNRLGQRGPTELEWDLDTYARRVQAFGALAIPIDGHDLAQIDDALHSAAGTPQPTVILAKTRKGRGFSKIEDSPDWHGKPLPAELAEQAIAELGGTRRLRVASRLPAGARSEPLEHQGPEPDLPTFDDGADGADVAPRKAFGATLAALAGRPDLVVLDAEVGNSTHTEEFAKACPDRFFECYIAEQQMIATAVGLSAAGYKPFAATFAAFLTRAHDFIRMAAISQANMVLAGTHCGVEIGPDGPSQMALEDLAMMRAVHGSTVLYPADATAAVALTATAADLDGISYLRLTRGSYPVVYGPGEQFPVGGSKVLRGGDSDDSDGDSDSGGADEATIFAAGVTVHEALKAHDELRQLGIRARVVDLYSVKPLDHATVARAARTKAVVIAEDHHPEGGLGEAVMTTLADHRNQAPIAHLAVRHMPDSRTPEEQLDAAEISARHIVNAVRRLLADLRPADATA